MNEETVVFIDAGYLSKLSKYFGDGKHIKLDIVKFADYLAEKCCMTCTHIYYYTAPPFQGNNPTEIEIKMKAGYDSFINKLKNYERLTVHEGRVQKIGDTYSQKGVDTLITMDLYETALTKKFSKLILISSDTDFVPVLERVRDFFKTQIILFYFTDKKRKSQFSLSNHLLTVVDGAIMLTKDDFLKNEIKSI